MQEDITQKQAYLYSEVIEDGYDPEAFQHFIVAWDAERGMSLDLYSIAELKKIVNRFKA